MKQIIVVEHGEKYQYNRKKEMVEAFLGKDFYNLPENKKLNRLRLKTYMNASLNSTEIRDLTKGDKARKIDKKQYIVLDEDTFLLSLAKNNDIALYENELSEEFTKGIDKSNLERIAEHYIRVNDCANKILEDKLGPDRIETEEEKEEIKDNEERI